MKVLIAPDSFKESLSAKEVADSLKQGWLSVSPHDSVVTLPIADGGEGTLSVLVDATQGEYFYTTVVGPMNQPVQACFGLMGDKKTAVIELAEASGLGLVAEKDRNPLLATSYGTGQLILAALDLSVERILIAIGGSACNDGGVGLLSALGVRFYDQHHQILPYGGGSLTELMTIDVSKMDPRLKNVIIEVACDVDNPLIGQNGASAIFGPQKGATPEMVKLLDANLTHFSNIVESTLGKNIAHVAGAGAAGGVGGALLAFLNTELRSGIDMVLEHIHIDDYFNNVDLVITGEGRIDGQTLRGKAPIGIAKRAKQQHIPCIAVAGAVTGDIQALKEVGIVACFSVLTQPCSLNEALQDASKNVFRLGQSLAGFTASLRT